MSRPKANRRLRRNPSYLSRRRLHCELLEPRWLLAGDCDGPLEMSRELDWVEWTAGVESEVALVADWLPTPAGQVGSSAAVDALAQLALLVEKVDAGTTFATALDVGSVGGGAALAGSVQGTDRADLIQFTTTIASNISLVLDHLTADLDLYLFNSRGQRLAASAVGGSRADRIAGTLGTGTYYALVSAYGRASSDYQLTVSAASTTTSPAPTSPTPTPSVPTTSVPTTSVPATSVPATSPAAGRFADVAYFGGANEWNLNAINAPESWARGYTGAGITVAIVDTGVDLDHADLSSQLWVNAGEIAGNRLDDDHNGYVDDVTGWDFVGNDGVPDDGNGHGTHVAGIVAAANNLRGSTGVAPGATIMPVRVLDNGGSGTMQAVAAGIRYAAENGAKIINLSLGGGSSQLLASAIQYAHQLGSLVIAAAGNEAAGVPGYPAAYSAYLSNVMSVGAHGSNNALAGFSNAVGASRAVQVDAPGVSIYSAYAGGGFARLSGTSMAAPHVAGLAALALSANPSLTPARLRSLIVEGADRSVGGSDSAGGIDAAATVAAAAASRGTAAAAQSTTTSGGGSSNSFNARHAFFSSYPDDSGYAPSRAHVRELQMIEDAALEPPVEAMAFRSGQPSLVAPGIQPLRQSWSLAKTTNSPRELDLDLPTSTLISK